jgi:hypothetical protein
MCFNNAGTIDRYRCIGDRCLLLQIFLSVRWVTIRREEGYLSWTSLDTLPFLVSCRRWDQLQAAPDFPRKTRVSPIVRQVMMKRAPKISETGSYGGDINGESPCHYLRTKKQKGTVVSIARVYHLASETGKRGNIEAPTNHICLNELS